MRYQLLCFIIGIFFPCVCFGTGRTDSLFKSGNSCYLKGNYRQSLKAYQQILDEGYHSAALYYNMGNASYKNGDIPSAILFYERGHRISPQDQDMIFNIRYVNEKTVDKMSPEPEFVLFRFCKALVFCCSYQTFAYLGVIFFTAGSVLLINYFFAGTVFRKKVFFYGFELFIFIGLMMIAMGQLQTRYYQNSPQAIVFSSVISLKNLPLENSVNLETIHAGAKVTVLEIKKTWTRVELMTGTKGWMSTKSLKEI